MGSTGKKRIHHDPSSFHFDATGGHEGKKPRMVFWRTVFSLWSLVFRAWNRLAPSTALRASGGGF